MRSLLLLAAILLLSALPLCAQRYEWIASGQSTALGEIVAMAVDSSDNVIVVIEQEGGLTLRDARDSAVAQIEGSEYWKQFAVVKYSPEGAFLWARSVRSLGSNTHVSYVYDICTDRSGALYLTGALGDRTIFPSSRGEDTLRGGWNDYCGYAVKYSSNGDVEWSRALPAVAPCDRIGTDGRSILYVMARNGHGWGQGMTVQAMSLDGDTLWRSVDARLEGGRAFGVSPEGSLLIEAHPYDESYWRYAVQVNAAPQLRPNSSSVFRYSPEGAISTLFNHPYPAPEPGAFGLVDRHLPITSISFGEDGRPAFAILRALDRPQMTFAGRACTRRTGLAIVASVDESGAIQEMFGARFAYYNSPIVRGPGSTWFVAAPFFDSVATPNGTLRRGKYSNEFVQELAYMQLDSTLKPMWGVLGGGTAGHAGATQMLPARGGGCFVASTAVQSAVLGDRKIINPPGREMAAFYIARLSGKTPPRVVAQSTLREPVIESVRPDSEIPAAFTVRPTIENH